MDNNEDPNFNMLDLPELPVSEDEEARFNFLVDDDWLKDPLDPFYSALGGPKLDFSPDLASSSFTPITSDTVHDESGMVGPGGTIRDDEMGGGINSKEKEEEEREKEEEREREKWKKKMSGARSLLMERRRTRKFNENLLKLRAVVPNISSLDKLSALYDAIDYVKELKQTVHVLQNEIESGSCSSSAAINSEMPPEFVFLGSRPAAVDVKTNDNGSIYMHMFCKSKPGLVPATLRALDLLELDIKQGSISSLTSFSLDVFCAKKPDDKPVWKAEDIKDLLLASIGLGNATNV